MTVSSAIKAPASWAILAISSTGCQAPVEVSAWTIPTTLGRSRWIGRLHLVGIEHLAIRPLDRRDDGAGAFGDVLHPGAEHAVDADQHPVARLDQVDDHRLHAGRAGPRDRQRQPVLGLKDIAEQALGSRPSRPRTRDRDGRPAGSRAPSARADGRRSGRGPSARVWKDCSGPGDGRGTADMTKLLDGTTAL